MNYTPCSMIDRSPAAAAARFLLLSTVIFVVAALSAFAGGSSKGDPRTFGAYQVDLDSGPVGITIQGHAATQVVTINEESIPSDIDVEYTEDGGILHVKAVYKDSAKEKAPSSDSGTIVATMPRYEFVHIVTSSGKVSIDNLSTDHLTIQTATGGIHVTNTNAALKAESTTGNQSYEQIYGAIEASSTTGSVSVSSTWGTMKLRSTSGSFVGTKVALAGNSSFQTSSGSIKVDLVYGLGRYTFDLESTSGKLRLGDITRDHSIRWGRGNITVTGVTKTGLQDFQ